MKGQNCWIKHGVGLILLLSQRKRIPDLELDVELCQTSSSFEFKRIGFYLYPRVYLHRTVKKVTYQKDQNHSLE